VLTGGGALIMSPYALLIKLVDLPGAEILMWRNFLSARWKHRHRRGAAVQSDDLWFCAW
jgi:hypothetical protein